MQSGPFVNRKTPRSCNLQSACAISADQPIDGWNFDRTRQPLFCYCWRLSESRSLIGRRTKRHVLTRALLYGRSCESQHLKSRVSRPLQTHANSCPHEIFFLFGPNDFKLAVEYVNIRQRKYARGIILYLKIGKHYLVLVFLLFCWSGCVEIRLRVQHAGCDSARAVSFDEIVVFFYLKSNLVICT